MGSQDSLTDSIATNGVVIKMSLSSWFRAHVLQPTLTVIIPDTVVPARLTPYFALIHRYISYWIHDDDDLPSVERTCSANSLFCKPMIVGTQLGGRPG